jgi:hypothetical protein
MSVNVTAVLEHAHELQGQQIAVQGLLTVYPNDDLRTVYLVETDPLQDASRIQIQQPFAEVRRILQPLPAAQLARRGQYAQLDKLYELPVDLIATVTLTAEGQPVLTEITTIAADFTLPEKLALRAGTSALRYQAHITYGDLFDPVSDQPVRAQIQAERRLVFDEIREEVVVLQDQEQRYAPSYIGQLLTVSGRLLYVPTTQEHQYHFIFDTMALRTSRWQFGLAPEPASIWIRPSELDMVLLAQMQRPMLQKPPAQRVQITGSIALLREEIAPVLTINPPRLELNRLLAITFYSETSLL